MAYSRTTWVQNNPPYVNATNLNNIETGVDTAHDLIAGSEGVVVHNGTDYATRPSDYATVKYIGPDTPPTPSAYDTWIDTQNGAYKVYVNSTWVSLPGSAPDPSEIPGGALTELADFELGDQDAGGGIIEDISGGGIRATVDTASAIQAYARAMTAADYGEGEEFWLTFWGARKVSGFGLYSRLCGVDNFLSGDDNVVRVEWQSNNRLWLVCSKYSTGSDWTGLSLDSGVSFADGVARKIECRVVLSDTTSGVGEIYVNGSLVAQGTGKTNESANNSGNLIKARVGVSAIDNTQANPDVVHELDAFMITATRQ